MRISILLITILLSSSLWSKNNKIFGGDPVSSDQLRGVVAVGINHCTGTLVSKSEVLTAAHCFIKNPSDLTKPLIKKIEHHIWIGSTHNPDQKYKIKYAIIHPRYTFNNFPYDNYDIAYVKLASEVDIDDSELIEVATKKEISESISQMALIAGFGMNDQENDHIKYSASTTVNRQTEHELFIGGHGTSICFGDSGGPALIQVGNKYKLAGVTSRTSSLYLGNPKKSCRDEGIFTKAALGFDLMSSQRMIDIALKNSDQSLLGDALLQYPNSSWASYWLGNKKAETIKLMPWNTSITLKDKVQDNLYRMRGYAQKGMLKEALQNAEIGVTSITTRLESITLIATLSLHQKGAHVALPIVEKALKSFPGNQELLQLKAESLMIYGDYHEASEILAQLPGNHFETLLLARLQLLNRNFDAIIPTLKRAISKGADLNRIAPNRQNLLQEALSWKALKVAEFLIEQRVELNHKSRTGGVTNLLANVKEPNLLRKMLSYGANVDAPGEYGYTALHIAAYNGNLQNVKILIAYGADKNARTKYRLTPYELAQKKGHTKVMDYLNQLP